MGDDLFKPQDQATENPQPVEEAQHVLREISEAELRKILEDHHKWLESKGKEGEQANLGKANLQGANLKRANLEQAYLGGANIEGANLNRANLKETILDRIEGISECNLTDANLIGANGLRGNELARMDLTGATLPVKIEEFKTIDIIEEISKNARTIFLAMLLACVYSWLTIATTTDVRLLTNSSSSPLPIIGTEIPIARFYWAAPFILICIFFYLHFYLYSLWEGLASLPAIFPDGKRLDERAYPWLLNKLVRRHFRLLKKNRPPIAYFTELVTIFLVYWTVPATLTGFWIRYLPRHDWSITGLHIGLIIASVASTIIFYSEGARTLQGKERKPYLWKKPWKEKKLLYAAFLALIGVLFCALSYGAINGVRSADLAVKDIKDIKVTVPWIFQMFGFDSFADFREKDVSIKPDDYYKIESVEKQIESVKGANLRGIDLRFADLEYSFLVKADLRFANLQHTQLSGANLQNSNLSGVMLQNANLKRANLQNADLSGAMLENANLERANLQNANLVGVKLRNANLKRANLQDANLVAAGLQEALLMEVKFQNAVFSLANFQDANLKDADLQGAGLDMVVNLNIEQLAKVATLYNATLDRKLMEQIENNYPDLLKKPEKE